MSHYTPTGYPRGRPRKGETRPDNPNARYQRERRDPTIVGDALASERKARRSEMTMKWHAENPDRVKEINKKYRTRKKNTDSSKNFKVVVGLAAKIAEGTKVRVSGSDLRVVVTD